MAQGYKFSFDLNQKLLQSAYLYICYQCNAQFCIHNIFGMLRVICISPFFRFCAVPPTPNKNKYIIKSKAYLIEAPPKRTLNGWALFIKQQLAGKKNSKVANEMEALAKRWNMYAEIREKYTKLAGQKKQFNQKAREEYEKIYEIPFKRINSHNLRLKKLFTDKKVNLTSSKGISGIGEQIKVLLQAQPRTLKEDEEFKLEAKRISEERELLRKKFQFPRLQYPTFLSFKVKHSIPVNQRGPTYQEDMTKAYQAFLAGWKAEINKWLVDNKYQITFQEFQKLHKKVIQKKKKKNYLDSDDSD